MQPGRAAQDGNCGIAIQHRGADYNRDDAFQMPRYRNICRVQGLTYRAAYIRSHRHERLRGLVAQWRAGNVVFGFCADMPHGRTGNNADWDAVDFHNDKAY